MYSLITNDPLEMDKEEGGYECMSCGRKITKEEYETFGGLCEVCHEIEIDELDYEDEHDP